MKLVMVLMLTALPLYCYAGIGCDIIENLMDMTIDPDVDVAEYMDKIQGFLPDEETKKDIMFMKQCFFQQSRETLEDVSEMKQAILGSSWCDQY
ncbi:mammaglobin-A [Artibeus jamaicensis]|uniref:mammaglobin-A n=1 Tax=Artibeus jamaicensis TaxID=9417 RepID=UPI00235A8BBC|nr:mammaglobin-A [Artibeus jamaicensis]